MYDFLIVGSGLFGSVFAHQAKQAGKSCLVIDKRSVAGGNIACENIEGINVHMHGAHIFHTNDETIWKFVNQFVSFNNYIHTVMATTGGKLYNLPFNMNTFYQIWGITDPAAAKQRILMQSFAGIPANLEQQALKLVGYDIYNRLIKEYTEKQWGRQCSELPAFIIKRLPVRFTFNNNYFNDRYQGIPIGGYNPLIKGLLSGVDLILKIDYFTNTEHWKNIARKIVYTGPLDQFYSYQFGDLEYRSLRFDTMVKPVENFQGCAVMNYTSHLEPYTRSIEHKHFENTVSPATVVTYEFPQAWSRGMEQYYPVNDMKNSRKFKAYNDLAQLEENIIFGGRLASYRYYDMHQVIAAALKASRLALSQ